MCNHVKHGNITLQRRVRRAPDITYDTVLLAGGGIVVVDQYGGFNGTRQV